MKHLYFIVIGLALMVGAVRAQVYQPPPATAAEVAAGVSKNKFVSPATLGAANLVTNNPLLLSYLAKQATNLDKSAIDDYTGAITELAKANVLTNVVDIWAMQPRWGTNLLSFKGLTPTVQTCLPWNFSNNAVTFQTHLTNGVSHVTNDNIVLPLPAAVSGAWTIALVYEPNGGFEYIRANTGTKSTGNTTPFIFENSTNPLMYSCIYNAGNGVEQLYTGNGAITNDGVGLGNIGVTNQLLQLGEDGFNSLPGYVAYRHTLVLSFDGTNLFEAWENGDPVGWPVNQTQTTNSHYFCSLFYTNNAAAATLNQLHFGFSMAMNTNNYYWNGLFNNATALGFSGKIHSIIVMNGWAGTNAIDSIGNITAPPMARALYKASRWFEPSETEVRITGTSIFQPGYIFADQAANTARYTNQISQFVAERHPEWPCIVDKSRAGCSIGSSTNAGYQIGSPLVFGHNYFYDLPAKVKRKIEITDHPRNDGITNIAGALRARALFDTYYAPAAAAGVEIWACSDQNISTNDVNLQYTNNPNWTALAYLIKASPYIRKWVPEFLYVGPSCLVDINSTNLSSGAHFDGGNYNEWNGWATNGVREAYVASVVAAYAAMLDTGYFQPPTNPYTGNGYVNQYHVGTFVGDGSALTNLNVNTNYLTTLTVTNWAQSGTNAATVTYTTNNTTGAITANFIDDDRSQVAATNGYSTNQTLVNPSITGTAFASTNGTYPNMTVGTATALDNPPTTNYIYTLTSTNGYFTYTTNASGISATFDVTNIVGLNVQAATVNVSSNITFGGAGSAMNGVGVTNGTAYVPSLIGGSGLNGGKISFGAGSTILSKWDGAGAITFSWDSGNHVYLASRGLTSIQLADGAFNTTLCITNNSANNGADFKCGANNILSATISTNGFTTPFTVLATNGCNFIMRTNAPTFAIIGYTNVMNLWFSNNGAHWLTYYDAGTNQHSTNISGGF
jgi:hypothetical protein